MRRFVVFVLVVVSVTISLNCLMAVGGINAVWAQSRPALHCGSSGHDVRLVQWKLESWGYYQGVTDGIFGTETSQAVQRFQQRVGLTGDGVVGPRTWAALGFNVSTTSTSAPPSTAGRMVASRGVRRVDNIDLLARVVAAEAEGEPYSGQVAVASTILNRVSDPRFPNTLSGVIFQPHAFESVTNGLIWQRTPSASAYQATRDAANGYDPAYGAVFFWNPSKPVNPWIWSRSIIVWIGSHVFAR
ncbi:MAG: spore cortex-lytic enzyme [Firmicutes bacterium]|nr:spore cortex-lytic enzyme [Bacillota bacterium]